MSDTCGSASTAVVDRSAEAARYRGQLDQVAVIGVTGSCGKTTTKDLIATILGVRFAGSKSDDTRNCGPDVATTLLAAKPDDDFLVQELGAWGPGTLDAGIALVRPTIAVVTNIRNDHHSSFHSRHATQAEKGKLVRSIPESGTAVLNFDDPLVRELSTWTTAQTLFFGRHDGAALHASQVDARWPRRLSFIVRHGSHSTRVETRLVGEHLLSSALAALGVAVTFGMDLPEAAAAMESIEPTFRRMSPMVDPHGVSFIRDDWKAPADSLPEALAFMASAEASRKIAVLGTISDYPGRSRRVYSTIACDAMAQLDSVIFVGDRAADLWGRHVDPSATAQTALRQRVARGAVNSDRTPDDAQMERFGSMFVFDTVRDAHAFLSEFLTPGDLVLLKGSGPADHLERTILGRMSDVTCWEHRCGRLHPCDMCELLNMPLVPSGRLNG